MFPYASQTSTLVATQDAKEHTLAKTESEKGKVREDQAPAIRTLPMSSPVKPTLNEPRPPLRKLDSSSTSLDQASSLPGNTAATTGDQARPSMANATDFAPVKRGRGRPRKTDVATPTGPPPAKRPRGRPRKSAPAAPEHSRNGQTSEEESEVLVKHDQNDESECKGSEVESPSVVPPNILAQFNAHVSVLRTRLDERGIPEQYSVFKSFWVPSRSAYFDSGASAPPARFMYWDPLFITSVACPVCQQPLAIAAGGGWLHEPLGTRDEEGHCWIIGRRYVCTQCFSATEAAAKYVQGSPGDPDPHTPTNDSHSKPSVDLGSPVYYLSWEERFRALLPPTLAGEFPKSPPKRAAFNRAAMGLTTGSGNIGAESDMDAEDEVEDDSDPTTFESSRRVRHCNKCGSATCSGRRVQIRCPNPCHDCGLTTCNGRVKPNVSCMGELCAPFKDVHSGEASVASVSTPPAAPPPRSISWPPALPNVPPGFVLAIPYAVGTDGNPTGAQPAAAYLVPQTEVPGFPATISTDQTEAASSSDPVTPLACNIQAPATESSNQTGTNSSRDGSEGHERPATSATTPEPGTAILAPVSPAIEPEIGPRAKQNTKNKRASKTKAPQNPAVSGAPPGPPAHLHPYLHPHPHYASYAPPPHPSGSPDPGYYNGYYPHSYAPYGYGYHPPYPPPQGPSPHHPGAIPTELGVSHYQHPQYSQYPPQGPYPSVGYPAPIANSSLTASNTHNPPPAQPQPRYMPYQPPDPNRPSATKKRKVTGEAGTW